jgi:hypothetical protein
MSTLQLDSSLTDRMVEKAVVFCAEKKFNGDTPAVRLALRQGRCDVCRYLCSSLVSQVSEYLGQMDRTVKAVYEFKTEASALRSHAGVPGVGNRQAGLNLIAWVDRKNPALISLGATFESLLIESRQKLGCQNATPACHALSLHLVDDKDVREWRGYGVMVDNIYVHSVQTWARPDVAERSVLARSTPIDLLALPDPEFAPEDLLFDQALTIEKMAPSERAAYEHRLHELKVALIRRLISDQLAYIQIAKEWFSIADLADIQQRKIGHGKIGGKAAGMLLAARILNEVADEETRACLRVPESYYIGSDVIYLFMAMNGLMHWSDQKYKPEEQIHAEYPHIRQQFQAGEFPPEILADLRTLLEKIGDHPIIVRSSSQLEDNFGTSFAGKYDSYFCPNQGTPPENLRALTGAITRTYASTLKPEALLYRRSRGLQDYDERMAILIQVVQGEKFGRYYLPHGAGVAFSRNLYRWSPEIKREAGFARLVWGLGTRAVERVGNDYPRLVALSHPTLQPDDSCGAIRHYSQQYVDLIDLQENALKTLPIHEVLSSRYPPLRFVAQLEQDEYFVTPRARVPESEIPRLAITYDELLRKTRFAARLSQMLRLLEEYYQSAVDVEFTLHIPDPLALKPDVTISLLQCRPQSRLKTAPAAQLPKGLPQERIVFSSRFIVPQGYLPNIRYVIFVSPEAYFSLPTVAARNQVGRAIGRLNALLGEPASSVAIGGTQIDSNGKRQKNFICIGPGRWGTTNTDLGVFVSYADIYNAGALVELAGKGIGPAPEPSLGTHFFQDLMEAQIYPVAICLDNEDTIFNREFFYEMPNHLDQWLTSEDIQLDERARECLRVIDVTDFHAGGHLELVMDDEQGQAMAFLTAVE